MSAPVTVVAVSGSAQAWAEALVAVGVAATALPHADVVAPPNADAVATALRVAPDLIVATSANAVAFLPPGAGAGLAAAAVGKRTAAALVDAGFRVEVVGDAGFRALATALLASGRPGARVVWLRGATASTEGAALLRDGGMHVEEVVAYSTVPRAGFADAARAGDAPDRVVVLGSGGAARAWLDAIGPTPRSHVVAVGETAAAELRTRGVASFSVAARPAAAAIVDAVRIQDQN